MGRKAKPDKMEILTARVKPDLYKTVQAAAERNEITMTQIVRQGVRMWLEAETKRAAA